MAIKKSELYSSLWQSCDEPEIAVLEAKFTKARQLRQGMMQEPLTGRIRLV